MSQSKLGRMQRLPRKLDAVARAAAIDRVADQRVTNVLEVHADLVRAPGVQAAFDERGAAEALEHPISRARRLAAMRDRHAGAHLRVAPDRRIDGAARWRTAPHEPQANAAPGALGELLHEI